MEHQSSFRGSSPPLSLALESPPTLSLETNLQEEQDTTYRNRPFSVASTWNSAETSSPGTATTATTSPSSARVPVDDPSPPFPFDSNLLPLPHPPPTISVLPPTPSDMSPPPQLPNIPSSRPWSFYEQTLRQQHQSNRTPCPSDEDDWHSSLNSSHYHQSTPSLHSGSLPGSGIPPPPQHHPASFDFAPVPIDSHDRHREPTGSPSASVSGGWRSRNLSPVQEEESTGIMGEEEMELLDNSLSGSSSRRASAGIRTVSDPRGAPCEEGEGDDSYERGQRYGGDGRAGYAPVVSSVDFPRRGSMDNDAEGERSEHPRAYAQYYSTVENMRRWGRAATTSFSTISSDPSLALVRTKTVEGNHRVITYDAKPEKKKEKRAAMESGTHPWWKILVAVLATSALLFASLGSIISFAINDSLFNSVIPILMWLIAISSVAGLCMVISLLFFSDPSDQVHSLIWFNSLVTFALLVVPVVGLFIPIRTPYRMKLLPFVCSGYRWPTSGACSSIGLAFMITVVLMGIAGLQVFVLLPPALVESRRARTRPKIIYEGNWTERTMNAPSWAGSQEEVREVPHSAVDDLEPTRSSSQVKLLFAFSMFDLLLNSCSSLEKYWKKLTKQFKNQRIRKQSLNLVQPSVRSTFTALHLLRGTGRTPAYLRQPSVRPSSAVIPSSSFKTHPSHASTSNSSISLSHPGRQSQRFLSKPVDTEREFTIQATDAATGKKVQLRWKPISVSGHGSFGVVLQAKLLAGGEGIVAMKKTKQDRRYKNRELQIMLAVSHPNIVKLRYYYYESSNCEDEVFLNLVLDHIDFGSAKVLKAGEPNVSYTCSRYYRAPELIFGSTKYTNAIGCILGELLQGSVFFPGSSGIDQLVEIIKVLGTPTRDQIKSMNPSYMEHKFPQIKPVPLSRTRSTTLIPTTTATLPFALALLPWASKQLLPKASTEGIDLLGKLLAFDPHERITACEAMTHPFFDEVKVPGKLLSNGCPLPPLFNFTRHELSIRPDLIRQLVPPHTEQDLWNSQQIDLSKFEAINVDNLRHQTHVEKRGGKPYHQTNQLNNSTQLVYISSRTLLRSLRRVFAFPIQQPLDPTSLRVVQFHALVAHS
ncbi:hypothetical protein T439DRAFT_333061 [Meredithblackwellia eburnea MCA 4105]